MEKEKKSADTGTACVLLCVDAGSDPFCDKIRFRFNGC